MEWCQDNIAQAVLRSKELNVIFVVYVEGKTPESIEFTTLLNDPKVVALLNNANKFLPIRIEGEGEIFNQFAQIYRLVPVPSLFFIGRFGQPIEIVTNVIKTVEELLTRIEIAQNAFEDKESNAEPTPSSSSSSNVSAAPANVVCEGGVCSIAPPSADSPPIRAEMASSGASMDDKIDHAKKMIEKKRIEREEEEKKREKDRELERRRLGKDMAVLKKMQEDQELKQLKEDRKREKMEEEEARRRVLEQIKMDRLERQQRFGAAASEPVCCVREPQVSPKQATAPLTDSTRIQFRKPDGDNVVSQFGNETIFADVRQYVQQNVMGEGIRFALASTFPRRQFKDEDDPRTLIELGLAPSAVLLVIPLTAPSRIPSSTVLPSASGLTSMLMTVFWTILTPVFAIWSYVSSYFSGPRQRGNNESGAQKRASEEEANLTPNDIAKRRNLARFNLGPENLNDQPSTSTAGPSNTPPQPYKRVGSSNIHRLHTNDSDDENNTWNGNSTQQM